MNDSSKTQCGNCGAIYQDEGCYYCMDNKELAELRHRQIKNIMLRLTELLENDLTIKKLNLSQGDVIVFKYKGRMTQALYEQLSANVKDVFQGHKAIVLEDGIDIDIFSKENQ